MNAIRYSTKKLDACPECKSRDGGVYYECVKCGLRGHLVFGLRGGANGCISLNAPCPAGDSHDFRKLAAIQKP